MALPEVKPGDKVLEIKNMETQEVAERFVVTGQSDRQVDRLARGIGINLDHDNWCVIERTIGE